MKKILLLTLFVSVFAMTAASTKQDELDKYLLAFVATRIFFNEQDGRVADKLQQCLSKDTMRDLQSDRNQFLQSANIEDKLNVYVHAAATIFSMIPNFGPTCCAYCKHSRENLFRVKKNHS